MLTRDNPSLYLVLALALVVLSAGVGSPVVRVLLGALGVAAAAVAVVLLVRRGRDPNGPPGQH